MAIVGYYLTDADGGSASSGVAQGYTKNVTFINPSADTLDGGKVEVLIDNTIATKQEVMRMLEQIKAAIAQDTWPPTGLSS